MKENYRLDDIGIKDYKIYQNPDYFCFGVDSVLLANFICRYIKKNDKYIDLCTGSAIIPILVHVKRELKNIITGIELDKSTVQMAKESLRYNNLQSNINIIEDNIKNISNDLYDSYDAVSVNPPYFRVGSGETNSSQTKSIARHEIECTLEDIIKISSKLLKTRGDFFMVHRADRFEEVIALSSEYNLHIKDLIFIHPQKNKNANLFLMRAMKNSGACAKVHPPVIIYKEDGSGEYTKEYLDFYYENNY